MKIKEAIEQGVQTGSTSSAVSFNAIENKLDLNKAIKMFLQEGYQINKKPEGVAMFRHQTKGKKTRRYDFLINDRKANFTMRKAGIDVDMSIDQFKKFLDKQDASKPAGFIDSLIDEFDNVNGQGGSSSQTAANVSK